MSTDFKPLILSSLETMRLGELARSEKFKAIAYAKAIAALKRHDKPIYAAEEAKDIDGVGKKIYEKIAEIVATGALKAADRMKESTNVDAYEILLQVHGIGPVKARELMATGIKTIADLRAAFKRDPALLNETQQTGLRFYEAGIQRIPRAEMVTHESVLLASLPGGLTGIIVGSYRRGAANSGDVDMLVTYSPETSEKDAQKAFQDFVATLIKRNYVVAKLVSGQKKWMGYIQLDPDSVPRRLDLLLTPPAEFAYALLYFTGSDRFNVAFRKRCLDLGYTLNEHTMKPTAKGTGKGVPLPPPMTTEQDIFNFVGLKFVPPTERVNGEQIVLK
jgi:DNA polymerase IV